MAIITSVTQSVLLVVKAHTISHISPLVIKTISLVRCDTLVEVITFGGATFSTDSLADYLAALTIHHALMGHLLVSVSRVFIHLMTLSDTISVTKRALCFRLISLFGRPPVPIILHRRH